ncbi:hypothetical protein ACWKSP_20080 [Micromonosporaceae bacterium Da 78-11]
MSQEMLQPSDDAVRGVLESDLPREAKLTALSRLILGDEEPATAPQLFAALRGFPTHQPRGAQ